MYVCNLDMDGVFDGFSDSGVFDGFSDSMSIYHSALDADKVAAIFGVCFLLCMYT